jgi:hypothetical protein
VTIEVHATVDARGVFLHTDVRELGGPFEDLHAAAAYLIGHAGAVFNTKDGERIEEALRSPSKRLICAHLPLRSLGDLRVVDAAGS